MLLTNDNGIYVGPRYSAYYLPNATSSTEITFKGITFVDGNSTTYYSQEWLRENATPNVYTYDRCMYCGRKAKHDECICEGCGAPL